MIRMIKQINNKIMIILVNLRKNNQFIIKKIYNKMINVNKLIFQNEASKDSMERIDT